MSEANESTFDVNDNASKEEESSEEYSSETSPMKGNSDVIVASESIENSCLEKTKSNHQDTLDQGTEYSLSDDERFRKDFLKLKADYNASLEREHELSIKLQKFDSQTVQIAELEILNEELREQLNDSLKECADLGKDLESVIQEKKDLQTTFDAIVKENGSSKALEHQIATLKAQCDSREKELTLTKDKLQAHDTAAKRAISALKKELQLRVDQVTKMYEDCLRERDNLALKVSQKEQEKGEAEKMQDMVEKKMSDTVKENENLQQALKTAQSDYKTCQASLLEAEKEMKLKQREVAKAQEHINSHAVKVKWAQNKLKTELDAHKETKAKLVQTTQKLKEAKEEGEQIRADCQAMIKQYQESEEMKSNSLDQELKLKESELEKHTKSIATQDENNKNLSQELSKKKKELKSLKDENNDLNVKINLLEEKVTKYALAVSTYEKTVANQRKEIDNQSSKIAQLDKNRNLLENAEERNSKLSVEKSQLTDSVNELESEIAACHAKESELLDFMEKMTAKCTQLQSTLTVIQAQNEALNKENADLKKKCDNFKANNENLNAFLKSENQARRQKEVELQEKLEEKSKTVQELATSLEDAKNELKVTKKRNAAHLKDLTRQLQHSKRKLEALEKDSTKEQLSGDSRASSSGSLDKTDNIVPQQSSNSISHQPSSPPIYAVNNGGVLPFNPHDLMSTEVHVKTGLSLKNNHELDHEKAIMLERICELQKVHAKKNEKMDFLEEHNQTLIEELTKKNKLIQYYMMKEDSGQLTSTEYDAKKAKLAKNRGIMSSVYSSKPTDSTMTLELSLQINKKLQALLEDTILKNMTLKENIDTLGDEVARLTNVLSEQCKTHR